MSKVKCQNCGNDIWDVYAYSGYAKCTNCGEERSYRSRSGHNGRATKSQEKAAKVLVEYWKSQARSETLAKVEECFSQETGLLFVTVYTTDSPYTQEGGFFVIGRRGKLTWLADYSLDKIMTDLHAERLGAHNKTKGA